MPGVRPPNYSTRLRRDGWPVGGGVTFILHGLHLQTFAISLHICAGVNLSFIFLLRPHTHSKTFSFRRRLTTLCLLDLFFEIQLLWRPLFRDTPSSVKKLGATHFAQPPFRCFLQIDSELFRIVINLHQRHSHFSSQHLPCFGTVAVVAASSKFLQHVNNVASRASPNLLQPVINVASRASSSKLLKHVINVASRVFCKLLVASRASSE